MKTALTIAGSDSSGGAGIQADLKTMTLNGVFAMSAITALTAQNTLGVTGVMNVSPEFLKEQIKDVFEDIRPDAVKIGMVSSPDLVKAIAESLNGFKAENVVVDPVMVATSGASLSDNAAVEEMTKSLFPLATLITPNIPEAEILSEIKIESAEDMQKAAEIILKRYGAPVLLKGGHRVNDANDLLLDKDGARWIKGERVASSNTHGTGCTLSSAIAANLAKEYSLEESVRRAKNYISKALAAGLDLGRGSGPMNHAFALPAEIFKTADQTANKES